MQEEKQLPNRSYRVGLAWEKIFGWRVRTVAHVLFRNIKPAYFKYWHTHLFVARWARELQRVRHQVEALVFRGDGGRQDVGLALRIITDQAGFQIRG
jgi:hypothetical protein